MTPAPTPEMPAPPPPVEPSGTGPVFPSPPVHPGLAPEHYQWTGAATPALLLSSLLFHYWERWKLGGGLVAAFVIENSRALAWGTLGLAVLVGGYTIVQGGALVLQRERPLAHRLLAAYGVSYAGFSIAVAIAAFLVAALRRGS